MGKNPIELPQPKGYAENPDGIESNQILCYFTC